MSTQFNYYYSHEAEQFTFYRIPKALFTEPQFQGLSVEAKVLYGLMLDRVGLSVRSGWVDENQRVYIYFTIADVEEQLGCGRSKAIRLLKELDSDVGLIRRKRQGLGHPDKIYVMNFTSGNVQKSQNETSGADELPRSPDLEPQKSENECSSGINMGLLEVSEAAPNNTEINKTESSNIESIEIESDKADGWMIDPNYMDCYLLLMDKWGYAALEANHQRSEIQGIFSLGADILSSKAPTVRVGKEDLPRQQVVDRLLSLDFTHIDYVLECVHNAFRPVRNMRSYLLTSLYNAPTTIDAYIAAQIAYNERGDTAQTFT